MPHRLSAIDMEILVQKFIEELMTRTAGWRFFILAMQEPGDDGNGAYVSIGNAGSEFVKGILREVAEGLRDIDTQHPDDDEKDSDDG